VPVAHERDHGRLQRAQVGLEDLVRVRVRVRVRARFRARVRVRVRVRVSWKTEGACELSASCMNCSASMRSVLDAASLSAWSM